MSVLNQKMDEQMPYFKRASGGERTRGEGFRQWAWGVTHAAAAARAETETGAAQGVLQVEGRQEGEEDGKEGRVGRPWIALHSSIKMRSVVCPKHKHTKLAPVEPRLFIINTKKTPRTNCSRCWACPASSCPSPFSLLCAEWLIIRRHRRRRCWSRLGHCRNSSVCGSNTCRAVPEIMCSRISND